MELLLTLSNNLTDPRRLLRHGVLTWRMQMVFRCCPRTPGYQPVGVRGLSLAGMAAPGPILHVVVDVGIQLELGLDEVVLRAGVDVLLLKVMRPGQLMGRFGRQWLLLLTGGRLLIHSGWLGRFGRLRLATFLLDGVGQSSFQDGPIILAVLPIRSLGCSGCIASVVGVLVWLSRFVVTGTSGLV